MKRSPDCLTAVAVLLACACTHGAAAPCSPPPVAKAEPATSSGQSNQTKVTAMDLLGAQGIRAFNLHGKVERVDLDIVPVKGQEFKEAIRAKVKETSTNPWDVQLQARTAAAIAAGDVILATFHFRTEWAPRESGEGKTEINVELAREPWTKVKVFGVQAAHAWRKIVVSFVAERDFAAGEAQVVFRLGYSRETIDIGGVTIENLGRQARLADLPVTRITYRGMEEDAGWRVAAAERIEKLRKADVNIVVKDKTGRPLAGAQVSARMKRHAFPFGTAAPAHRLLDPESEKYREVLLESFNTVTLENDLKWVPLAGDWGPRFTLERVLRASDWLKEHGIDLRGHVLVWPGWKNLPKYLRVLEDDPVELHDEVERRIRDIATAMKGRLIHWDVLNEPFDNHDLFDILGDEIAVEWFQLARMTDPAPKLFINDYAILAGGGGTTAHRDHFEGMIQMLVDQGAPLDGIGMQGHFGTTLTAPEDMLAILDRYAKFGKTIWITEYDVVVDDEEIAGKFTRDFYTTMFSHPAVGGIVMWGFWDADHWKKNSGMYRKDWSLKPTGKAYRDLVLGQWWTEIRGETDSKGVYSSRGFLGDYEITVQAGGKTKTVKASLRAGSKAVVVAL
jgi:endo-1,4-beta-xylanase